MVSFLKRLFGARSYETKPVGSTTTVHFGSERDIPELHRLKVTAQHGAKAEQLKAWTCNKCGATLPDLNTRTTTVKCTSCGTVFQIPQTSMNRLAGVHFNGETINVDGDIVGGDLIVIVNDVTHDQTT